ncbi:MAG: hypothetical protein WAV05_05230 [Anaerolineales bacterium]
MDSAFQYDHYVLKKQVIALTGTLRIYNSQDQLVLFSQQKIFKLKEDIRVYADEMKSRELLTIKSRQIIDFSAFYDVVDSQYLTKLGGFRRKGLRSLVQDEWEVFDPQDNLIGVLKEDSIRNALLRRLLLGTLIPQNYDLNIGVEKVADFSQRFQIFRYLLDINFQMDTGKILDHRLGIAAAILLAIIEGRQHKQG